MEWIGAPAEAVPRQGGEIEIRVLAAERKLETTFAVLVPMARTGVAAGPAVDRRHTSRRKSGESADAGAEQYAHGGNADPATTGSANHGIPFLGGQQTRLTV